jgi:P27 family predicted phage terminase small subunit
MTPANPLTTHRGRPQINAAATALGIGAPDRPATLSEGASKYWDQWEPVLVQANLLSPVDSASFTELCETAALIDDLRARLREDGPLTTNQYGAATASGAAKLLLDNQRLLLQLMRRFGLTPSDRSTMRTQLPPTAPDDPLMAMFARRAERNAN